MITTNSHICGNPIKRLKLSLFKGKAGDRVRFKVPLFSSGNLDFYTIFVLFPADLLLEKSLACFSWKDPELLSSAMVTQKLTIQGYFHQQAEGPKGGHR